MESSHYYKLRMGRPPIWETPDALQNDMSDYLQFAQDNPLEEEKLFNLSEVGIIAHNLKRSRLLSLKGFCSHVGHTLESLKNYEDKPDFFALIKRFRELIENQQIEGAASGIFKENIIARLNGLADKTETDANVKQQIIVPDNINEHLTM